MRRTTIHVTGVVAVVVLVSGLAWADDIADVEAAEIAFNAAQKAGRIDGMAKFFLSGRTIYGPAGGALGVGWN